MFAFSLRLCASAVLNCICVNILESQTGAYLTLLYIMVAC
jgi:hypothetical protein